MARECAKRFDGNDGSARHAALDAAHPPLDRGRRRAPASRLRQSSSQRRSGEQNSRHRVDRRRGARSGIFRELEAMKLLRIGICALVAFAVLAHGAVEDWAKAVLEVSAGLLFLFWSVMFYRAYDDDHEIVL